jgi:hypothetical protein
MGTTANSMVNTITKVTISITMVTTTVTMFTTTVTMVTTTVTMVTTTVTMVPNYISWTVGLGWTGLRYIQYVNRMKEIFSPFAFPASLRNFLQRWIKTVSMITDVTAITQ